MRPVDPHCLLTRQEWRGMAAHLARCVRDLRGFLGWSQDELARRAATSQGTISRLESGACLHTPFRSVVLVMRALGNEMETLHAPLPEPATGLLHFVRAVHGGVPPTTLDPTDPDLQRLVTAYHALAPRAQAAFVPVVCAVADALGAGPLMPLDGEELLT